jgi:hypothetical protein
MKIELSDLDKDKLTTTKFRKDNSNKNRFQT